MRLEEIKEQIISAFPCEPIPSQVVPEGYECIPGSEYKQINDLLGDTSWRDVTWDDLEAYEGDPSAIIHFLSTEGLKYYIPTLIFCVIEHLEEADVLIDVIVEMFRTSTSAYDYAEIWNGLSCEQQSAYVESLNYISSQMPEDYGPMCCEVIRGLGRSNGI